MINTNVFNKSDASDEAICNCLSHIEESDCYLCRVCLHFSKCVGFAMKRLSMKLKENDKCSEQ